MYTPPQPTQKTPARATLTKIFLLLIFTAGVASSLGYVQGQDQAASGVLAMGYNAQTGTIQGINKSVQTTTNTLSPGTLKIEDTTYYTQPSSWYEPGDILLYKDSALEDNVGYASYNESKNIYEGKIRPETLPSTQVQQPFQPFEVGKNSFTPSNSTAQAEANAEGGGANTAETKAKDDANWVKCSQDSKDDACKNACSTRYIKVDKGVPSVKDCYGQGQDKASDLIDKLATCLKNNKVEKSPEELKQTMCITKNEVEIDDGSGNADLMTKVTIKKINGEDLTVPAACEQIVKDIKEIREGKGAQQAASQSDITSCTWKGAVLCGSLASATQNSFVKMVKQVVEKATNKTANGAKKEEQQTLKCCKATDKECMKEVMGGNNNNTGFGGGNGNNSISQSLKSGMSGLSRLLGGLVRGLTGSQSSSGNSCDNVSYRNAHASDCANVTQATCSLKTDVTSIDKGDPVSLTWQTTNATKSVVLSSTVGITMGSVSSSGTRTIYPSKSGTITLTATGATNTAHKENECTASVGITVSGTATSTPTSQYTPTLTCVPSAIEDGSTTEATISWACKGASDTSEGTNFDTSGATSGSVSLYPTLSNTYKVDCYDGTELIGTNSCVIAVEEPLFDLVVYPQTAAEDERVRVCWGSMAMSTCTVQGPDNFRYDTTHGVVITVPFPEGSSGNEAIYTIECASKFGDSQTMDVAVTRE